MFSTPLKASCKVETYSLSIYLSEEDFICPSRLKLSSFVYPCICNSVLRCEGERGYPLTPHLLVSLGGVTSDNWHCAYNFVVVVRFFIPWGSLGERSDREIGHTFTTPALCREACLGPKPSPQTCVTHTFQFPESVGSSVIEVPAQHSSAAGCRLQPWGTRTCSQFPPLDVLSCFPGAVGDLKGSRLLEGTQVEQIYPGWVVEAVP